MSMIDKIKNPDAQYRPVPFWSWNDKLDNKELQNQIKMMHEVGIGGYFMHARGGLLTEYMGEEWFEAMNACLEQGNSLDMRSWAYDENGWPSGFGDGRVNGLGVKYQQKYLRCETVNAARFESNECTVALYSVDGCKIDSVANIEGNILHIYYDINQYYVDTLDREVTEKFIEEIYQKYYDKLSEDGRSYKKLIGFFTDEPQVSRNGMPWSFILEEAYIEAYDEPLLEILPQLFFKIGNFRRTRYRIWKLITRLFMDNFMKPLHDWSEQHGWKITGHHVLEESYWSQLTSNGAIMPQYQYYHIPGMDWLGRHIKPVTTPVQVVSVCAQLGKKQILSETFAMCGWNVKLEELKWIFQWQMVHGINLLCQHLESYSLKGIRKRDYPASLFRHQPWWRDYRDFNDYVSRIGVLLAKGDINVDVLILHGQSSAWIEYTANEPDNNNIEKYFQSFNQLSDLLDIAHVNYHYGDETMIDMHGRVSDNYFEIGKQKYSTVVIPQLNNLSVKVYELLKQFISKGGKVMAVKDSIGDTCYVSGEKKQNLYKLLQEFMWFDTEAEIASAITKYSECCPIVQAGTDTNEKNNFSSQLNQINYTQRFFNELDGEEAVVYYFVNNDLHKAYDAEIYLPDKSVERFDPATGDIIPIKYERCDGMIRVPHYFFAAGDLVLIGRKVRIDSTPEIDYYRATSKKTGNSDAIDLNGEYSIELKTENIMTLDYCSFSFNGELQEENEYVLVIQDRLIKKRQVVNLELSFKFKIADDYDFGRELFLIIEQPELFDIKLNGKDVKNDDCGFLHDPAFRRVAIKDFVQAGDNVITLNTVFKQSDKIYEEIEAAAIFEASRNKLSYDMEIEAIYLAGDFGVKTSSEFTPLEREAVRYAGVFSLTKTPAFADISKLHESNLPFFSGTLILRKEFELSADATEGRLLKFNKQKAVVSKVKVNGKDVRKFLWKPFIVSLDGMLKKGNNIIEIELTNSLRNMLGPHHLPEGEPYAVGPFSFYKENGIFSQRCNESTIPWNDEYCFVEFGIDDLSII